MAILLAGVIVIQYFISNTDSTLADPFSIYNDSTRIILKINNTNSITQKTYSAEFNHLIQTFWDDSSKCATFLTAKVASKAERIFLAFDSQAQLIITLCFSNPEKSEATMKSLIDSVKSYLSPTTEHYQGTKIYHYRRNNSSLYISETSGVIFISETLGKLKESIQQTLEPDADNPTYSKLIEVLKLSSRQSDANLFLNLEIQSENQPPYYRETGWCVLDVWAKNNALILNGLSPSTNPTGILSQIQNSPSTESTLQSIVPNDIRRFFILSLPASRINNKQLTPEFIQEFIEIFGINPNELIQRIYNGEIASFTNHQDVNTIALKITGESVTNYLLESMITKASQQGIAARKTVFPFDPRINITIFEADWNNITGRVFGQPFSMEGIRYAFVLNNTLFFTETRESATTIVQQQILNQSLIRSEHYLPIKLNQATTSNVFILDNIRLFDFWLTQDINQTLTNHLKDNPIQVFWQISTDLDRAYHNLVVTFSGLTSDTIQAQGWKIKLNSPITKKPQIIQPQNSDETFIVLQDSSGTIYFLNDKGRIIWQKNIETPLLGNVNRVDINKNGDYLLVFSTAQKIFCMQPDGTLHQGFPIELPMKATSPVAIFDYESNFDYRLAIAMENRRIAIYDLSGKLVPGWDFKTTDGIVTTAPQHFKIGTKDYILVGDTLRIYILDRRGNERVKPKSLVGKSIANPFYYSTSRNRWFTTTTSGDLMSIALDGTIRTETLTTLSPKHFYLYADFLADQKGCHIFADSQQLIVTNSVGKKIIETTLPGAIADVPHLYQFAAKQYGLGIVDRIDQKMYLFSSDGKQLFNFPMHGSTPFSIYPDKKTRDFRIVAGKNDGYVYNSKIK